mmetsp:Transcript_110499/g.165379  ORF Transcript_110499/g.165379 Transcript_110499/m.165379 type:complete len:301 (-) Transcript_110499:249-1151(-)|eukprot:CAMPEP_0117037144 /NCGR_PEP_ID=MMETSP0472-20121206/26257_1 /TAXON_ID=693140 ORGANISM="Tiarina fusus, Strain LIS" /NCGR_SAMPLE_ID=MMETSP0472 /ASSEMBLY_ACC=CAM_ASM_000603 /LENGTH=300 /DNA_ID=CAMNT_0004747085 /DNA_START=30 /DNA_END=932 /DNA_ORIENTATION=-
MPRAKKRSGSNAQFPVRLHDMMEFVEANGLESVISWVLGGRGFMIHDPNKLVEILSLFFGQTKYTSFRRQLNMWHFDRIVHGPSKGTFLHPYFVKGNRELCGLMSRQIKVRDSRRPNMSSHTKPEELGSFKSEVNECTLSRNQRSNSPSDESGKSDSSVDSSSRQTEDLYATNAAHQHMVNTTSTAGLDNKVETINPLRQIYPAPSPWSLPTCETEEYLDLEPSPIAPMPSVPSSLVANFQQNSDAFPAIKMNYFPSSNLSPTNDEKNTMASLFDDDLGSFAGKQFFYVDGNGNNMDLPC